MFARRSTLLSLLVVICGSIRYGTEGSRPVSVIAHMVNTPNSIRWALAQGANGIEIDLKFEDSHPARFHHGFPCDCTCFLSYATFHDSGCMVLGEGCSASTDVGEMTNFLGSPEIVSSPLAIIFIDAKLDTLVLNYAKAGANVVRLFNEKVLARGYRGQIILGSSTISRSAFLRGALREAANSIYADRYFYTIGQEGKNAGKVLKSSLQLNTKNIVYNTGASACFPYKTFYKAIRYSLQSKAYAAVGIWTVDQEASIRNYLNAGVDFIVTNRPKVAADIIGRQNVPYLKQLPVQIIGQVPHRLIISSVDVGMWRSHTCVMTVEVEDDWNNLVKFIITLQHFVTQLGICSRTTHGSTLAVDVDVDECFQSVDVFVPTTKRFAIGDEPGNLFRFRSCGATGIQLGFGN